MKREQISEQTNEGNSKPTSLAWITADNKTQIERIGNRCSSTCLIFD